MTASNPKSKIENSKSALAPPQFGLRTLLLLVTAFAILFALTQAEILSPMAAAGLVLLALSIFCHVVGNCLGTRLRSIGDHPDRPIAEPNFRKPQPHEFAPATHLSQRKSLGWIIVIATFGGVLLGGVGGGVYTLLTSRGLIGATNIAVGVIAFATLGGIISFAVVGFTQVLGSAICQALNSSTTDSRPPTPDPHLLNPEP